MPKQPIPPLTLPEYERLFQVIHAVVSNEKGDPSKACIFFGFAGTEILRSYYKFLSVRFIAGFAGYNLRTPDNKSLVLGTVFNDELVSNRANFHCWIEADDWIIDLTAPLFDAMANRNSSESHIPNYMFQKPLSISGSDLNDLNTPGTYIHIPNTELTKSITNDFFKIIAHVDLISICKDWYARPPIEINQYINIGNQHGEVNKVSLSNIHLTGSW